jgi:hypothetical protein
MVAMMRRWAAILLLVAGVVAVALAVSANAQSWPGCDSFGTQLEAQTYWESHGQPAEADGDGDGKVCESLPAGGGNERACSRPQEAVAM